MTSRLPLNESPGSKPIRPGEVAIPAAALEERRASSRWPCATRLRPPGDRPCRRRRGTAPPGRPSTGRPRCPADLAGMGDSVCGEHQHSTPSPGRADRSGGPYYCSGPHGSTCACAVAGRPRTARARRVYCARGQRGPPADDGARPGSAREGPGRRGHAISRTGPPLHLPHARRRAVRSASLLAEAWFLQDDVTQASAALGRPPDYPA